MIDRVHTISRGNKSILSENTVLRNTMILLSLTFLFSSICAYLSMAFNAPPLGISALFIYMGLVYGVHVFQNSGLGILLVFALTGFLGYTLGPILNMYLHTFSNGSAIISTAFLGTAMMFGGLAGYVTISKKDFSYLGGFLAVGTITIFLLSMLNLLFFQLPIMSLAVSAGVLLLSSGWILFELSEIISGGQTNYVVATVSIFVQLYNIFLSLLRLLSAFSSSSRD